MKQLMPIPRYLQEICEHYRTEIMYEFGFGRARVGNYRGPQSKIDPFAAFVVKGIGYKADIAPFKFCYVDIIIKTDIEKAFASYLKTMSRPREEFPKTALKWPLINFCSYW